jgi:NitT/TauT family transport system substrate-binding protein/putative hydroxymethylpyrimidine transport system substrate-binding protein
VRRRLSGLAAALAILVAGCGGDGDEPARRSVLALDFQPNAAHAGVYTALARGDDREQGIHLMVRAPSASTDSLKLLTSRRADLAILDIHDLGLARERGEDLVGVAAVVQQPLAAVIAREEVRRPRDLEGRRAGVTGLPSDDAVLRAVVEGDGGDFEGVERVTIGFSAVPSLIAGKVDGATAFWNAEGVALRERGARTRDFRVADFGAPPYPELVLVVRRETLRRDRDLVERTVAALKAGTEAASSDPNLALDPIAKAGGGDRDLVRAQLAAIRPALSPALRLDRRALDGWAAFDERFGILERKPDVGRAFSFDVVKQE